MQHHAMSSSICEQFKQLCKWLLLSCVLCVSGNALAEQKKVLGNWDVHYIVFPTTTLTPEVARANNIQRSKYKALINISVLDSKTLEAQDIDIQGNARNLLGNVFPLTFKQVNEGQAIYYLATVDFDNKEMLRFSIDITQGNTTRQLKFQQTMYTD